MIFEWTWVRHEIGLKFTLESVHKNQFIVSMLVKSIWERTHGKIEEGDFDIKNSFENFEKNCSSERLLRDEG